jgi:hypothetical protein
MFKRKSDKIEMVVEKEIKKQTNEGNGKALIDSLNDPDFKKAMIKASSDSDIEAGDPTKFTLLENLHNRDTADYYTEYKDKNEVEQVNRLQTWQRLFPVVFGDVDNPSPTIKLCQEIVKQHVKDNMVNRASLKRRRESALVYAVKQDTGIVQTDKQVASFLGKGR